MASIQAPAPTDRAAPAQAPAPLSRTAPIRTSFDGSASYYWHGTRVASGDTFDPHGLTAAHRTLPFGTRVRVTDPASGRNVVVIINDRGPFTRGRVLDLSLGAAKVLGMTGRGVIRVQAEVI
jgi:rare lipoprotein A